MTRVSTRNARGIIALLVLALVPIVLHSYIGFETDECANPSALIPPPEDGGATDPRSRVMQVGLQASRWREGVIQSNSGAPALRYAIVRSYEARRLYYRAERRLLPEEPQGYRLEWIEVDGEKIPVHQPLYDSSMRRRAKPVVAYLLVYDGRVIENPYLAQLLAAPSEVLTGRLPMTLLFAYVYAMPAEEEAALAATHAWLAESWRRYRVVCMP